MKVSIRTNILLSFLTLVLVIATLLLYAQYYFSTKIAVETTQKDFKYIASQMQSELLEQRMRMKDVVALLAQDQAISETITPKPSKPLLRLSTHILMIQPHIAQIFYSDVHGSFYSMYQQHNKQWRVEIGYKSDQYTLTYNSSLELLDTKKSTRQWYPAQRPWYEAVQKSHKVVITHPYIFQTTQRRGISYVQKLQSGTIVGIDVTLQRVAELLSVTSAYKTTELIIVDNNNHIIATTDTNVTLFPSQEDAYLHGYYQYRFDLANNEQLVVQVQMQELLAPFKKNLIFSLAVAMVLILLVLPLVYIASGYLVRPIKQLILENMKIKKRNFSDVQKVTTNIIEFDALSTSMVSMSQSIQEYQQAQERLLDSIIKLIAEAIDAKSPYTGGHCRRVPKIAMMLLEEANKATNGSLASFRIDDSVAKKEFEIAAWLHDCGKVTTPEYVVDKGCKLETIYNRIHEIRTRFEVLLRDSKIAQLQGDKSAQEHEEYVQQLHDDFAFIASVNLGGEFLEQKDIERIKSIAQQQWKRYFDDTLGLSYSELQRYTNTQQTPAVEYLLCDKEHHKIVREHFDYEQYKQDGFKEEVPELLYNLGEVYNLSIQKGTLTPEERFKIDEHVIMTYKMLQKIPFPECYSNIPQYAASHHETLTGTGYPRKLDEKELSVPARILAIADIFEALSAHDRPYKKAKKLSECIQIMSYMAKDKIIDPELFELFVATGLHKKYAKEYFDPDLIDEL